MQVILKESGSNTRLTLASDGRITLKYAKDTDSNMVENFKQLIQLCVDKYGVPAHTLRGQIKEHKGMLSVQFEKSNKEKMGSVSFNIEEVV